MQQAIIFPLGAVPKPHDPSEYRPFGDHTKSRLNEAGRPWKHSLDALNELKRKLSRGRFMRMSDIDGAFTLLALVPWLWPYMLFVWFDVDTPLDQQATAGVLYAHLFADFGTVGCPGKIVRFHIDNSSFQASAAKGWSHAERLNELLRELLYLTVKFNCCLLYTSPSPRDS